MNNASFDIEVQVPKLKISCKNCFVSMDELFFFLSTSFHQFGWKNTMIIPTPSIESDINDFVMESFFVDSISKLVRIDSKPTSLESTSINYGVESSLGYSKPKLFMDDSKLELVVEPKFSIISSKMCRLVEVQLFYWSLSEINGLKIIFSSVVLYFGLSMPITNFFQLTMVFGGVWFLVKPSWKSSCKSSLCSLPPSMVASNPL